MSTLPLLAMPQDTLQSSVYRQKGLRYSGLHIVQPSDVTYRLWEGFTLVRKANAGDAAALHELGIRYLTGQGFPPDTIKAFQLIQSAAEKDFLLAYFNLGVFYHNGWGTEWNPFTAYTYFKYAAEHDLKEGEFAYGLYFTDGLAVPRDFRTAYRWVKKSADQKFSPASDILPELERLASQQSNDSSFAAGRDSVASSTMAFEPVLLDFMPDENTSVRDSDQAIDIVRALGPQWQERLKKLPVVNDSILFGLLQRHALWGIPEEYTVLGRFYEKGIGVRRDSVEAAIEYLRAVRLESRRAPQLLLRLLNDGTVVGEIQRRSQRNDPEALYAVACFALSNLYGAQQNNDIISFLQRSADDRFVPSMVELANAYFSGTLVLQQKEKAVSLWQKAYALGSQEARMRLASAKIIGGYGTIAVDSAFTTIEQGVAEESLPAELAMGFCFEKGVVVRRNLGEAAKYYRRASSRGSRIAYSSLRRLYDAIRPSGSEFRISDQPE